MRKYVVAALAVTAGLLFYFKKNSSAGEFEATPNEANVFAKTDHALRLRKTATPAQTAGPAEPTQPKNDSTDQNSTRDMNPATHPGLPSQNASGAQKKELSYVIDDGLAVIQGDLVIGEASRDQILKSLTGVTPEPQLKIWPSREIAYAIQPQVENPERILKALSYFAETTVVFVPYTNQRDVLVFEKGSSTCKSYLGYIGGRQPVWTANGCGAHEIAHEVMHALGFLHEQNRSDRDLSIEVLWNNINPQYKINFEKFSDSLMSVSGLTPFDYESIMLYPPEMFSTNSQPTMKSKTESATISPRATLSSKDIERINQVYAP